MIQNAVTKGIYTEGSLFKASGVEWLGEIPEHWEVKPLKHLVLVKARLGWKGLKAEEYVPSGYGFLATPNIKTEQIDFVKINFITEERYLESPEIMLEVGDVLLAKDGSTLGIVNFVDHLPFPSTVNSSIAVLRVLDKQKLNGKFLHYFIKSHYMQSVIDYIKDGQGVPHLFQADIKNFATPLPSLTEQSLIVNYIEQQSAKLTGTIERIEQEVSLLKEYRVALISEAVTGKIDVQDA
jgi:type I restriction enzyme, S subunit